MADGLQAPAASARLRPMHKPPLAFAGIIPAGEDTPAEPPPEGARLPSGSITISPWTVVSKCALRRGPTKRSERPGHPQTLRFGSLLLVDHRFPACVILPQMNHQPMCIWMVKPPFTQYISRNTFLSVRIFRVIPTDRLGRTLGGARSAPDTFLSGLGDQPCPARLFVGAVTWDGWG